MKTTRVRARTGRVVHGTYDARKSLCSRSVDGFIVEPDADITCKRCCEVLDDIARGN